MPHIRTIQPVRVREHRGRLGKSDAMLAQVRGGLPRIPFEHVNSVYTIRRAEKGPGGPLLCGPPRPLRDVRGLYEPPDERNDLRRSGNWSPYEKGTPGLAAMLQKLERVLERHRGTRFVAVHSDLGAVGALLDGTRTWTWTSRRACGIWPASRSAPAASS